MTFHMSQILSFRQHHPLGFFSASSIADFFLPPSNPIRIQRQPEVAMVMDAVMTFC